MIFFGDFIEQIKLTFHFIYPDYKKTKVLLNASNVPKTPTFIIQVMFDAGRVPSIDSLERVLQFAMVVERVRLRLVRHSLTFTFVLNVLLGKLPLLVEQASVKIVCLVCIKRRKERVAAIRVPKENGITFRVQVLF